MFTMLWGMATVKPDLQPERVGPASDAGPTRRERARAQTRAEILAAARELIRAGDELSMRAVARTVGMTAPGLYRYVDGHDDLVDLLGGALYDELIADLVSARDGVDQNILPARLNAIAHAFRSWALAHRNEYALLFANPLAAKVGHQSGCTHEGGQRFGAVFAEVFAAMWQAGMIVPPDLDQIDPALLEMLEHSANGSVDLPLGVHYLFVRQWARLYGIVTLEAFGHLHWALEDGLALFEAMLDDCAAELGPIRRGTPG